MPAPSPPVGDGPATLEVFHGEQLVEEHERFAVVEMVSWDAAKLARKSDPRQWRDER